MADRLMQLARHASELPQTERQRWDEGLHGLDIGDELVHLRMCLAVAQAPWPTPSASTCSSWRRYWRAARRRAVARGWMPPAHVHRGPAGAAAQRCAAPGRGRGTAVAQELGQMVPLAGGRPWGCVNGRWAACCSARF
jgi:uncharacterized membrane protein YccC